VKWTSRILILTIFIAAMFGCQKGQKAVASKEGRSSSTKSASASTKSGPKAASKTAGTKSATSGKKSESKHEKVAATVHPGVLTMVDNGRTFDVKQGEVITVKLDSNRASGFSWNLGEDIGEVVKLDGKAVYARNTTKAGKVASGGSETWRFRTAGAGQETVKLEYRRSWERNIPERTFRFTVIVH